MKVVLAQHAGACYGVRRALDLSQQALFNFSSVVSYGSLIHNPAVVQELTDKGMSVVDELDTIDAEAVVIRSHGAKPSVFKQLLEQDLTIVDATCPHVSRAQNAAARLAKEYGFVLIIGEIGHPEVESLCAFAQEAGGKVIVAQSEADLPDCFDKKFGVVVQTTTTADDAGAILNRLDIMGADYEYVNTICSATQHRQAAAVEMASQVDAVIVLGGKNSANTCHLYNLCSVHCPNTHHVESTSEINPSWFVNCDTVGLTAGASTPEYQVDDMVAFLEKL